MQNLSPWAIVEFLIRSGRALLLLHTAVLASAELCPAQTEELPIVRISSRSGTIVGELEKEDDAAYQVFDFQSSRSVSVTKTSVTRIENPITLDDAARYVGLPAVMGRKISVLSKREAPKGKIAKVSPQIVYLTLGQASGITAGQRVSVYRGEGEIVDPDTGVVLASERARIAELEISEVTGNVSKARLLGDLEIKLEVGDEVELQNGQVIVAVCPPSNEDGSENPTGSSLAEQLISALVQRKVSVVERSALDMVLAELLAQNTILFDQKSAQQLGKLTGANMVLTGKVIQENNTGTAHLRLIDVQTGEILIAVSAPVKSSGRSSSSSRALSEAKSGTSSRGSSEMKSGSAARTSRTKSSKPSGELEELGKSKALPGYLTTSAALERGSDGGVRFQGPKKHDDYHGGVIVTRDRDFLEKDFVFEVLVTFGPNDGIAHIGIGSGRKDGSASRRVDSVFIRFHAPNHGDGEIQVEAGASGRSVMGKVPQEGTHLVRLHKEGDSLTIQVDPENDGPTDDDLETVIPDLREAAPFLNSKNSSLFIGGTGTIMATRLKIL